MVKIGDWVEIVSDECWDLEGKHGRDPRYLRRYAEVVGKTFWKASDMQGTPGHIREFLMYQLHVIDGLPDINVARFAFKVLVRTAG